MAVYRFDDLAVISELFRVEKSGHVLPLEPKAIRVLIYLIENRRRVVSKDELLQAVWENTCVTDNALTRVIALLRKTLCDDARNTRYIETVATHGYRFVAELSEHPFPDTPARQTNRAWRFAILPVMAIAVLAVVGIVRLTRPHPPPPSVVKHLEQLTRSDSWDASPSFSPDGSAIAYASNRDGLFQIYVRQMVAGGHELQLTHDDRQNVEPAWSPDGRYLAYCSMVRRGIFRIPALGGSPLRMAAFGSQPAWSPDGKWIAFRSQGVTGESLATAVMPDWPSTIWMAPVDGGELRGPITSEDCPRCRFSSPQFSPDGQWIVAIDATRSDRRGLWSINLQTQRSAEIQVPLTILSNPSYSPDGRSVYVAGSLRTAERGIWRVPIDATTQRAVGDPLLITLTGASSPICLALSRDGRRLAYAARSEQSTLRSLPLSPETCLPSGPSVPFTPVRASRNTLPAFSPDGSRLAWYVTYQGSDGQIWVADSNGANAAPLVTGLAAASAPRWMPDGRSIRYTTGVRQVAAWSASLDPSRPQRLADIMLPGGYASLSPNGEAVAYWRTQDGVANVWKAALKGGQPAQLTFERESVTFPSWSPDGKWIVANLTRGEDKHVVVFPSTGGAVTQLTDEPGLSLGTGWSPDSGKVVYSGLRQGVTNLYWVSRITKEVKQLTNSRLVGGWVRTPAWSPRGDQLVYEQMDVQGNIFILDLAR